MYRQKKLSEDCPKSDGEKSSSAGSGDESNNIIQIKDRPIEAPTSSSSPPPSSNSATIMDDTTKLTVNKSPDIVSSTLPKQELSSHLDKSMEMLRQIFPGKPQKILEAKLREARGDVVKALELCAKYFDQKELKSASNGSAPLFSAPPSGGGSRNSVKTSPPRSPPIAPQENNNNPFMLNFSNHVAGAGGIGNSESAARFPPPFSTAAMAAMLANSQHKSAFIPTTAAAAVAAAGNSNQLNHHHFYRNFEHGHHPTVAAANFLNKELFPFPPPPLFPPSFFVGFGNNHLVSQAGLTAANLATLNDPQPTGGSASAPHPSLHRPCVDPLCGQCAATSKVDSTDDNNTKDNEDDLNHD